MLGNLTLIQGDLYISKSFSTTRDIDVLYGFEKLEFIGQSLRIENPGMDYISFPSLTSVGKDVKIEGASVVNCSGVFLI